jgi:Fe2+ transport system protein FeoA
MDTSVAGHIRRQHRHGHGHDRAEPFVCLDELQPGRSGVVSIVGGTGALRRRLLDMGITPGTRILFRKTAPLGDPIEITLRGYDLSLRKADAHEIVLTADQPSQTREGE